MVCLANSYAKGVTGVRPELAEMIVTLLNEGFAPPVRRIVSAGNFDIGPLAAALDFARIELVVAAQAIDLRAPGQLGLGTGRAFRMIRELVPFTQADGTLPADPEPVVELVARGDLTPAA